MQTLHTEGLLITVYNFFFQASINAATDISKSEKSMDIIFVCVESASYGIMCPIYPNDKTYKLHNERTYCMSFAYTSFINICGLSSWARFTCQLQACNIVNSRNIFWAKWYASNY